MTMRSPGCIKLTPSRSCHSDKALECHPEQRCGWSTSSEVLFFREGWHPSECRICTRSGTFIRPCVPSRILDLGSESSNGPIYHQWLSGELCSSHPYNFELCRVGSPSPQMGALLPRDKARVLLNYKPHLTPEYFGLLCLGSSRWSQHVGRVDWPRHLEEVGLLLHSGGGRNMRGTQGSCFGISRKSLPNWNRERTSAASPAWEGHGFQGFTLLRNEGLSHTTPSVSRRDCWGWVGFRWWRRETKSSTCGPEANLQWQEL